MMIKGKADMPMFHLCLASDPSNSPNGTQLNSTETNALKYTHPHPYILCPWHCTSSNLLHKNKCNGRHAQLQPNHPHSKLGSMDKSTESRRCHWKIVNRIAERPGEQQKVPIQLNVGHWSIVVLATRPPAEIIHIIARPHCIQLCITVSLYPTLCPTVPFNSPAGKLGFHCARFTASSQRADSPSSWTRDSWTKLVCGTYFSATSLWPDSVKPHTLVLLIQTNKVEIA